MPHAKRGIRLERNGITFRSKWEMNVSLILDLWKDKPLSPATTILKDWQYEPQKFDLRPWYRDGAPDYCPDFRLEWADGHTEYLEVKGFSQGRDRNQIRRWRRKYGYLPLIVVTDHKPTIEFAQDEALSTWSYRLLERQYKPILEEWKS